MPRPPAVPRHPRHPRSPLALWRSEQAPPRLLAGHGRLVQRRGARLVHRLPHRSDRPRWSRPVRAAHGLLRAPGRHGCRSLAVVGHRCVRHSARGYPSSPCAPRRQPRVVGPPRCVHRLGNDRGTGCPGGPRQGRGAQLLYHRAHARRARLHRGRLLEAHPRHERAHELKGQWALRRRRATQVVRRGRRGVAPLTGGGSGRILRCSEPERAAPELCCLRRGGRLRHVRARGRTSSSRSGTASLRAALQARVWPAPPRLD
mmetsp:Transcript_9334/g.27711  ORF Transcript_9334/g.27711 Transcript_9334/m.27711 type:complete len:259 (-) Transcript_9334:1510-2286(-)